MKKLFLAALLVGLPVLTHAQTSPGFGNGTVPTASQWNSYFSGKVDTNGGVLTNPTINGGTVTGTLSVPTGTAGASTNQAASQAYVNSAASGAGATALQKSSNLSDLTNASTARTNLGLGTAATSNTSAFDAAGTAASTLSAAIGTTVAPLPLPATDLPAATSGVQGAMSLATAGAQAPVQSVAGLTQLIAVMVQ